MVVLYTGYPYKYGIIETVYIDVVFTREYNGKLTNNLCGGDPLFGSVKFLYDRNDNILVREGDDCSIKTTTINPGKYRYGVHTHLIDVNIDSKCKSFTVSNDNCGGDPFNGIVKYLYDTNGNIICSEGSTISISKYKQYQSTSPYVTTPGIDHVVICHIYDPSIYERIILLNPHFFQRALLFLSVNPTKTETIHNINKSYSITNYQISEVSNLGCDIGGNLTNIHQLLNHPMYTQFDKYYILHSKTDLNWRNEMINPLVKIGKNYPIHQSVPSIYGAQKWVLSMSELNRQPILDIFSRNKDLIVNNIDPQDYFSFNNETRKRDSYFLGGTCFLTNRQFLEQFRKINISYEISILEDGHVENVTTPRRTHAWEYIFGIICYMNGGQVFGI